ncbi:MAG: hypothetical protein ACFFCY_10695 [Promethearchaeota archaeon]
MSSKNDLYIGKLRKTIRNLISQNQVLKEEKRNLEKELDIFKNKSYSIRKSPMICGVVIDILNQEKNEVIIALSTGPLFVVNLSNELKNMEIKAGMIVALNQRTLEVMEILPISDEEIKKAKELIYLTELTLKKE